MFGQRLQQVLDQRDMTQSDLARVVWGKITLKNGYEGARNRDRISKYLRGLETPERSTVKKIAKALGVRASELAPEIVASKFMLLFDPDDRTVHLEAVLPELPVEAAVMVAIAIGEHDERLRDQILAALDGLPQP
jgi:transcriptional regulator with XRE-family HTH domain